METWWIYEIELNGNDCYRNITIHYPPPIFVDISDVYKQMCNDISSMQLNRLISTIDRYLFPNVLCPWGCTEYPTDVVR